MESRLLRCLPAMLVLLMPGITGCAEHTDLANERSPDAPAHIDTKAPASASSMKPGSGFQTKTVGSDTSLKVTK